MHTFTLYLLLFLFVLCVLPSGAWAFGAGDIPDFAYLNDKAFRHGDIENILTELAKAAGHGGFSLSNVLSGGGGSLLGIAAGAVKAVAGGGKFSKDDVKKSTSCGNWLRDYSQAMDIAGLSKLSADSLVMVVALLGFMEFGYATLEFEVNAERLGVYLPVEHIDNPKGYAEKEGDARQWHKKLRPPVDPRELEIDERTGMKNYMATEGQGWDTSTDYIRRSLRSSIEHARRANCQEGPDLWEAYRTLGQGLHTLEDLLAHSNWCEIALRKMGHQEVFCHVGQNVVVNSPNGAAPPLITGTFGGADFLHSLLGESMDKLSQTSMTDIAAQMEQSKNADQESQLGKLKDLLGGFMNKSGGNADEKMTHAEALKAKSEAFNFNPDDILSGEVQQQLRELLQWHDDVMRDLESGISNIPGLTDLIDSLSDALNAYVQTLLAPYIAPILGQVSGVLSEGSKTVIDSDDQYAVFNDDNASDPSHSMISKDHFALILNEPAGKVARIVVAHTVGKVVEAWGGNGDPDQVISEILEAFHHPYYATGSSEVQNAMFEEFQKWFGALGPQDGQRTIEALTKESVREHRNKRLSEEQEREASKLPGLKYGGHVHSNTAGGQGGSTGGSGGQQSYGRPQQQQTYGGGGGNEYGSSEQSSYGGNQQSSHGGNQQSSYGGNQQSSYGRSEQTSYGQSGNEYGSRRNDESSYGRSEQTTQGGNEYGSRRNEDSSYGRSEGGYGQSGTHSGGGNEYGRTQQPEDSYGSRRNEESTYGRSEGGYGQSGGNEYGRRNEESSYGGGGDTYGSRRTEETSYGGGDSHGSRRNEESSYSRSEQPGHGGDSYGSRRTEESSYGGGDSYGSRRTDETSQGGGDSYGRRTEESSYGRSEGGGYGGSSGYGGASGGYGQSSETYGVERMNLGGRDENENHGRHHKKRDSDDDDDHRRRRHDD
ncbi:Het-C-domain-containing protein [Auriculariales sp. MPI-PUGE-AT-0066]|nr:Het-C-domain-containing protein [Auriculariales sp. MPI-PUGE-AT-0066]